MTDSDKLDLVIVMLKELLEDKKKRAYNPATSDSVRQALQGFLLEHTGKFKSPEIAEMCGLPQNHATYLEISRFFKRQGIFQKRTNKERFYLIG